MPQLHAQPTHSPSLTPTHTPTHTPTLFPTANPSSSPVETCPANCSDCRGETCTDGSDCCGTNGEGCYTFPTFICIDLTKSYNSTDPSLDCTMICSFGGNLTEECAGLGIDSANIGCGARDTSYCTVESRTNAGKCDNC